MESLDSLSDQVDLSDLLEDLFGGDNEETMFPSMLNVEYTQGR
jgi:hypothetical protein